jgi:hypothetical protein
MVVLSIFYLTHMGNKVDVKSCIIFTICMYQRSELRTIPINFSPSKDGVSTEPQQCAILRRITTIIFPKVGEVPIHASHVICNPVGEIG